MTATITYESDFYFWIVDYLHKLGPIKMYPRALADAADLALELIADLQHEEEALQELVPSAELCPCCGDDRNQALGVVFHLARDVDDRRPYSEAVIHFLAKCYCPPASTMFEQAARIGFQVAGLHRSGFFREFEQGQALHLVTTQKGRQALGIRVHLEYALHDPFFRKRQRAHPKQAPVSKSGRPVLHVVSSE
jgi:hypothetical protein